MASLKIVLDKRRQKADKTYPLIIRVTNKSKSRSIPLNTSLLSTDWDEKLQVVLKSNPNYKLINHNIKKRYIEVEKMILKLDEDANRLSISAIRNKILNKGKKTTVFEFTETLIKQMKSSGKIGNAKVYQGTINRLILFSKSKDLEFADITYDFLVKYEASLISSGLMGNSVSLYLRTLRSIYNKAIKSQIVERTLYPFHQISIRHEKTKKRAISKEKIKIIENAELPDDTNFLNARNYFILSFNLIGISFMDMALLKNSNIVEGRLTYIRKKTGKYYSIKLTEKAKAIVEYYQINQLKKNATNYLLPIIPNHCSTNPLDEYKYAKMGLKLCNTYLRKIATLYSIEEHLTTYVTRHSWATIAKKMGYSVDLIAEALGHSFGNKVTSVYLDSFDSEVIDEMNEKITRITSNLQRM